MASQPRVTAILPCTNLLSAIRFFVRLGFIEPSQEDISRWDGYVMLAHPNGSDLHLTQLGGDEEGWLVPGKNPFGLYIYSEDVEALAKEFASEIIEAAKTAEVKPWGMVEFSLNGPDEYLA
ncbi:hypothetical protein ANO11243_087520 [Dothideomycetidae sp. 11243]|nr:hypothetical protein ANO11243_087520 [fungal sp. No.11243]